MEQAFKPTTFKEIVSVARDQSLSFNDKKRMIALSQGIIIPPKGKQNKPPPSGPRKKKGIVESIFNVEFDSGPSFRPNINEMRRVVKAKRNKAPKIAKSNFGSEFSVPKLGKRKRRKRK